MKTGLNKRQKTTAIYFDEYGDLMRKRANKMNCYSYDDDVRARKEKDFDGLSLGIQDKKGFIHFLVCDDGFADFGIGHDIIESLTKSLKDGIRELLVKQPYSKGIRISNIDNRIFIDIYCILKYGISVSAVAESLKKTIKYRVEDFTGMIVDTVNIHVVGVRV